jgi:S1-C subfamily serine protease
MAPKPDMLAFVFGMVLAMAMTILSIRTWARKFVVLFFATLIVVQSPTPRAWAAVLINHSYGAINNWTIGYSDSLEGCMAEATYTGDTTLTLGFQPSGPFMVFTNPNWGWIVDEGKYEVSLRTEPYGTWSTTLSGGKINGGGFLYVEQLKDEFWIDVRRARNIVVSYRNRIIANLSLDGSNAAILAVRECLDRRPPPPPKREDHAKREDQGDRGARLGSGFFISTNGDILTNNHVVRGCSTVQIWLVNSTPHNARVMGADEKNDLALVRTDLQPKTVPAFRTDVRMGNSIAVYGFPLPGTLGSSGNFTMGHITALEGPSDDTRLLQIQAPIQPGNSGGPVLDEYGNVSGVVVSKLDELKIAGETQSLPQMANFAIKAAVVLNFLEARGARPTASPSTQHISPAEIAERAQSFTVQVACRP